MTSETPEKVAAELAKVGDYVRYAVSRFNAAGLAYGHGTTNALDEACFLILESLHLPISDINPYADARLLPSERLLLAERINERVLSRKPAAYIAKRAYIGAVSFYVDERVIVPRSFIGELLIGGRINELVGEPSRISRILDVCTGSGCLAVLAARAFPQAEVHASDISPEALEVARINVEQSGAAERISLFAGDLFAPLRSHRYDLILANPPYVSARAMASLPPEYRHEPELALAGGEDGLALVRRIMEGAASHLEEEGALLCEIGAGREQLEEQFPDLEFLWLDTEQSSGEVFWLEAPALLGLSKAKPAIAARAKK